MAGAFDDFKPGGAAPPEQPKQQTPGGAFSDFGKPVAPQTTGDQQTTSGAAQPSQGWGINWHGDITMPQPVQDWGDVAGNEAMAYGIPSLRAQAEAARKRLDPATAASADFVGATLSPTNLLNLLPGGAPIAGGLHEGLKSYMSQPDWWPDAAGRTKIADDAAMGAITGGFASAASAAAPKVAPILARVGVQGGIPTVAGAIGHQLFGQGDVYRELAHMGPEFASVFALDEAGKRAAEMTKNAFNTPFARQAIQNLILGGGSAARQAAGPYDQWFGP